MPLVTKHHTCKSSDPPELQRLDRVVQSLSGVSRRQALGLLSRGCVKVNGELCESSAARLHPGDLVELRYDPGQRYRPPKPSRLDRNFGFEVIYQDSHLIVVEKPAELLTVPTHYRESDTLVSRVSNYLAVGRSKDRAFVVHRLDRGVSGLLVFAKSLAIAERLRDQFEDRKPEREYLALVAGVLDRFEGTFESRLVTEKNLSRRSTRMPGEGELAITHYRVSQVLDGASLVSVRLETGRRNQIRVHFAEAGHPVLGDSRYRADEAQHKRWPHKRLALHAASLGFTHPISGERMSFESALPPEFEKFLKPVRDGRGPKRAKQERGRTVRGDKR